MRGWAKGRGRDNSALLIENARCFRRREQLPLLSPTHLNATKTESDKAEPTK